MWFMWSAFPHCVFSNVSLKCLPWWMYIDTGCIVLDCECSLWIFKCLLENNHSHTGCIYLIFLYSVIKCLLVLFAWEDAKSQRLNLSDFASLCGFKCSMTLSALKGVFSHWLHLFDFSPLCIIKFASNRLMCLCWAFKFLATLVALHFTPVSKSVAGS